jgi:hypothetical protein
LDDRNRKGRKGRGGVKKEAMMLRIKTLLMVSAAVVAVGISCPALAVTPYSIGYTDGGTWNMNYAQGFSPYVGDTSGLITDFSSPVFLTQFQFYKSGTADTAANFKLAIVNNMYPLLLQDANSQYYLPASSIVGVSTNTIASSAPIATGQPITFTFDKLQLRYANDYAANFVTVGAGGNLYPVLVSSLTANYALGADNNYHPVTNYGNESQYQYSTSNYITAGYYNGYSYGGDSNFTATFQYVKHGDFNGDGVFDGNDVPVMLQALANLSSYESTNNLSDAQMVTLGDFDGDGVFTNADIQGMLYSIENGIPAPLPGAAVPEPESVTLLAIGFMGLITLATARQCRGVCLVTVAKS